jgi:hypothetical protein
VRREDEPRTIAEIERLRRELRQPYAPTIDTEEVIAAYIHTITWGE